MKHLSVRPAAAKLMISSMDESVPSYLAKFMVSPCPMRALVNLSRYCFLR